VNRRPTSPRISNVSWGAVTVESHGSFKDVKLYPGGAREWDWRETGTNHSPGIQPSDVEELVSHGASVVILATGMLGRLKVCRETLDMLERQAVEVRVRRTESAVRDYNVLRAQGPVGALIHSTC
jgi:hypothetical protein